MIRDKVEKPDIYYVSSQPADIISVTEFYPEPKKYILQKNYFF
jgi:hypothetical protein